MGNFTETTRIDNGDRWTSRIVNIEIFISEISHFSQKDPDLMNGKTQFEIKVQHFHSFQIINGLKNNLPQVH